MKEVYLQFSGRSKSVRIQPLPGQSDVFALRAKLVDLAAKDSDLLSRMHNSSIIFQKEKTKGNGTKIYVDVEEDEDIPDECDLQVIFASLLTSTVNPEENIENQPTVQVLRIVPLAGSENSVIKVSTELSPRASVSPECAIPPSFISPPLSGVESITSTPSPSTLSASASLSSSRKKPAKKEISSPASLPFALPPLTAHLKSLESVISSDPKPFIKFYGDALRSWSNDAASQGDYDSAGKAVITRHQSLADKCSPRPHGIVCSLLSQYIRNAKSREKKHKRDGGVPEREPSCKPPQKRLKFSVPQSESNGLTDEDMNAMDLELQKLGAVGDTPHVKRLMKDSFPIRRSWISSVSESTRPSDILARFPHLQNVDLLLQELTLRVNLNEKIDCLLKKVETLFEKLNDTELDIGNYGPTDVEKLNFILALYNRLKPKNVPKRFPDLVTIKEALSPLGNDLDSNENEGARVVVYTSDKILAVAFLVADETKVKIEQPTVAKCILLLIAFYHAMDRTYPTAYKGFFSIFDEFLLKVKINSVPISYKMFKKNYLSNITLT